MIDHLNWRYATKKFDPSKKIPPQDLEEILEVLRFAPSSCGLQPWKFIVIKDMELRKVLRSHSHNQSQVTDAQALIVLCCLENIDEKYVHRYTDIIAEVRGVPRLNLISFEQMMLGLLKSKSQGELLEWMKNQVYLALGFFLNECAHRRIDACPMEGFDSRKFDEILGLSKHGLQSVVLCPVGYRAADDHYATFRKVRFDANEIFINKP